MNEYKPNWYKALKEDPLHNHSFNQDLSTRIMQKAAQSPSRTGKYWTMGIWSGAAVLALLGFVLVRMFLGSDFLMQSKLQLQVAPTDFTTAQPSQEPVPAPTLRPTPQPMFNGRYLVHNGFYYNMTDAIIPLDQIGEQIGTVKRIGTWAIKKEWDTNQFTPGSQIYTIKGVSPDESLAIRTQVRSPKNKESSYDYLEVKRDASVEVLDPSIILSAKGDPEEVAIALNNIHKADPDLYTFSNLDTSIELESASFVDQYTENASVFGTKLNYIYPLADDTTEQGFIEVNEYSEEMKLQHKLNNSIFSNRIERVKGDGKTIRHIEHEVSEADLTVQGDFELNGLRWKDYGDQTYITAVDGHYYEIKLQGKLSDEQLKNLLSHFGPAGRVD
jgi:hypothetical protein